MYLTVSASSTWIYLDYIPPWINDALRTWIHGRHRDRKMSKSLRGDTKPRWSRPHGNVRN